MTHFGSYYLIWALQNSFQDYFIKSGIGINVSNDGRNRYTGGLVTLIWANKLNICPIKQLNENFKRNDTIRKFLFCLFFVSSFISYMYQPHPFTTNSIVWFYNLNPSMSFVAARTPLSVAVSWINNLILNICINVT